ncbi:MULTISPECIES: trehalose-phosphatase [Actinomadura]|uniref:Trehalose 6-phosphate phosphatase n=1 Tax=Actinomadura yumaensis TaxID=111807 RepID=A0ABW2CEC1_9ACTN|nr:trehalose-phosphatase [Actinomadura sp. J1-007]MWK34376.1 trehalose-phosphatase [Actinomadura sp. J1-007]
MTADGADGLDAIRTHPAGAVLGFDFDGTLAPIVDDPAAARAHPRAAGTLARLAPHVGCLVIVTGRPAAVAVEYGGFDGIDGLVVLGQYGLERWESGTLTEPEPPPGVAEARAKLPEILKAAGAPPETFVEDKRQALAVHTRRCAEPEVALERLRGIIAALAERTGLAVEPGRFVLELRPPGMDKGKALRAFIEARRAGTAGAPEPSAPASDGRGGFPSAVLFAGDDLGDLAAYDAIDAFRSEGVPGVKVCSGSSEVTALAERADVIVDGPEGVVAFLDMLLESLA